MFDQSNPIQFGSSYTSLFMIIYDYCHEKDKNTQVIFNPAATKQANIDSLSALCLVSTCSMEYLSAAVVPLSFEIPNIATLL